jgi:acyl-CoA synthetase (AMP-forming)/AMP-acid ligase II
MNVADIVSRHAADRPDSPAVVERGRTLSYREFDAAVDLAAAAFLKQGIAPGDVVGVTLPNNALHLVTGYALARMGAVQLSLPAREAATVRAALAAKFGATSVVAAGPDAALPGMALHLVSAEWMDPGPPVPAAPRAGGGDRPWKIAMTSGTTGAPKAVLQTHAMHLAWRRINQAAVPLRADDRFLVVVEPDFFAGMRLCMDVHWAGGAVIVGEAIDPLDRALDAIERLAITYLYLTPVHLHRLLGAGPGIRARLASVRMIRTGAMVVPEELRRRIRLDLSQHLVVAYGTNDAGSPFTIATGETLERFPDSVGFPVEGVELQVVDEAGAQVAPGVVGQIRVRTEAIPQSYIANPAASARAFRDGWYYPGDLGLLSAEGVLHFRGRLDDLMNHDGIKIYPVEIEQVLLSHPAVAEAAAFPTFSPVHQHVPTAAVTLRAQVSADALQAYCNERLGVRTPRAILLLREMPRTIAGKVDKRKLSDLVVEAVRRRSAGR